MPIKVDIVTPEKLLYSGEIDMITLPGALGQMGILHGHAPLLSTLDIGEIILHKGSETQFIAVGGGVVEVRPNKVTILADTAEVSNEIDAARAAAADAKSGFRIDDADLDAGRLDRGLVHGIHGIKDRESLGAPEDRNAA